MRRVLPPLHEYLPHPAKENLIRKTFEISLATLMFGGGVRPGEFDFRLIRGNSIRGQLRFWWRATRGARCETIGELREEEFSIWGSTKVASKVAVKVIIGHEGRVVEYPEWGKKGTLAPPYVLFPFRPEEIKDRPPDGRLPSNGRSAIQDVRFKLELDFPSKLREDVESAVWAWVNFGGIGSRTRRGCGALFCKELAPPALPTGSSATSPALSRSFSPVISPKSTGMDQLTLKEWYQSQATRYGIVLGADREWPTLPIDLHVRGPARPAMNSWKKVIDVLRIFRQGKGVGRNPGSNQNSDTGKPKEFGRSRWPEADSIRRVTKNRHPTHATSITMNRAAFPRAEFGLPIVFRFIDHDKDEPAVSTLCPGLGDQKAANRMASPLILKPLCIHSSHSSGGGSAVQAVELILRLQTPSLTGLYLEVKNPSGVYGRGQETGRKGRGHTQGMPENQANRSLTFGEEAVRGSDMTDYINAPMHGYSSEGSALEAFMAYARKEGFV